MKLAAIKHTKDRTKDLQSLTQDLNHCDPHGALWPFFMISTILSLISSYT